MTTDVSPENAKYIEQLVKDGAFDHECEALNEVVGLLKIRQRLRDGVQAGIDQADAGEFLPADEVFSRLENRADEIGHAARTKQ